MKKLLKWIAMGLLIILLINLISCVIIGKRPITLGNDKKIQADDDKKGVFDDSDDSKDKKKEIDKDGGIKDQKK